MGDENVHVKRRLVGNGGHWGHTEDDKPRRRAPGIGLGTVVLTATI